MPGMYDDLFNMTVEDVQRMGLNPDDVLAMLEQQGTSGGNPYGGYDQTGFPQPPQGKIPGDYNYADLAYYKALLEQSKPPSPTERRLTRNFVFPNPDEFSFDALQQSDPYIRELLNSAVVAGEGDPFRARAYLASTDDSEEGKKIKAAWGQAVDEALPDFERIADEFYQDDPKWATRNKDKRRKLLAEHLNREGESWLSGAAPSASRNVNWADWVESRQTGEEFPMYQGAGFDLPDQSEPRLQTDPSRWGSHQTPGMAGEMSQADFRTYQQQLGNKLGPVSEGTQIDDPNGGYWVLRHNRAPLTPLQKRRQELERQSYLRRQQGGTSSRRLPPLTRQYPRIVNPPGGG